MFSRFLRRADPSPVSNGLVLELSGGLIHIKAIRLSKGDAVEQAVQGGLSLLSALIVALLLAYILSLVVRPGQGERAERSRSLKRFLKTDNGLYCMCLLVCDLFPAMSGCANIFWSTQFLIQHSRLCVAQGVGNQFGSVGVAYWNLCLAVTTFFLLVVRVQPPKYVKWIVFAFGIIFDVLMCIIGPIENKSPFSFFGPNSAGCWLTFGSNNFKVWYDGVSFLFLSVLFVMLVLYGIIFLSLSGALARIMGRARSSQTSSAASAGGMLSAAEMQAREVRRIAKRMLWFPLAYGLLSLPLTVSILLAARGTTLSHAYYSFSEVLWVMNSAADAIIFILTRRHLLRSHPHAHPPAPATNYSSSDDPTGSEGTSVAMSPPMRPYHNHPVNPEHVKPFDLGVGLGPIAEENERDRVKQGRRGSGIERKARGEGEDDSHGLVGTERDWAGAAGWGGKG